MIKKILSIIMIGMLMISILMTASIDDTVELVEIPELRLSAYYYQIAYICYKDTLVIDRTIYKKQNGSYKQSDKTLCDILDYKNEDNLTKCRQYENFLVTTSEDKKNFLLYDMELCCTYTIPCKNGVGISEWYIYDSYIVYNEYKENTDKSRVRDNAIREISLTNGVDKEIYRKKVEGLLFFHFMIRDDGAIICEWMGDGYRQYWLIQQAENEEWEEKKLWENNQWKFEYWKDFNQYGLVILGQFYYAQETGLTEIVVIKDNGEVETLDLHIKGECLFLDNGYLLSDVPYSMEQLQEDRSLSKKASSVTFYNYKGNALETYQLIDCEKLVEGFSLEKLLYHDGKITALYVREDTGELYISQVEERLF